MHKRKRQDAASPAVLHLDVFSVLLLDHHIRVYLAHSVFPLGLDDLQVAGNSHPGIVERLVGVVAVDQGCTRQRVFQKRRDGLFLRHGIDFIGSVYQTASQRGR